MLMMEDDELDAHQVDSDFEPQSRPRSCTWPLPCPEDFPEVSGGLPLAGIKVEPEDVPACRAGLLAGGAPGELKHPAGAPAPVGTTHPCMDASGPLRKAKSSRRNAWGNQSYADLITRAIESTPEKRLTLSQIYDWMVRYVPYFKDKGDSNSSAGWKNSIRHNLSLHTRFIRVQNEGTGKSSWWMLNPDGGKMGKAPRRRAVSMDNSTKYLKSKGRIRGKRVGRPGIGAGSTVVGLQGSPDHSSPPHKGLPGSGGTSGTDSEFDAWTDLHSRASSSASTLSGRLSPILAEGEPEEPDEGGLSCSTSPHLYPSPTARSPSMGAGNRCPPLEQLPQLTNLTGAISLDEQLMEDGYHHHHSQQQHQQHPSVGRHKHQTSVYHYSSGVKGQTSYGTSGYGTTGMGMMRHHSPMQTIQENKPARFSGTMRTYSSTNALQSLLTGGAAGQPYCPKEMMLGLKREGHTLMSCNGSNPHSHHVSHHNGHGQNHNGPHSHSHNRTHSHAHAHNHNSSHSLSHNGIGHNHTSRVPPLNPCGNGNLLQTYNHKSPYLYSPPAHAHLPASTTLPPNPAGMLGMPQDSCHLATAPHPHPRHNHYPDPQHQAMVNGPFHHGQGMVGSNGTGGYHHGYHQPHPHERLPADLDIDMFQGSLDCDVESILLHDIMDSGEEMDFNFDCSLAQGVGIGMGMGMGVTMGMGMGMSGLAGPQQTHSNQSWVPG
ncbi:forkhead box protein O3-like [Corythoichthys intestinalis]|uniref:forkhead box protein O3-like n=1 Tax=Corythoichthys intestinalis TaxID=161448 RepID=UPI0025A6267E|nr:forkhead box protein O3-like [Corythoichthys intestinalis]XP_061789840.1 forkhead box protein O3-like [Nerophis lumbriciformis]